MLPAPLPPPHRTAPGERRRGRRRDTYSEDKKKPHRDRRGERLQGERGRGEGKVLLAAAGCTEGPGEGSGIQTETRT